MSTSQYISKPVVVLFSSEDDAQQLAAAVRRLGIADNAFAVVVPGQPSRPDPNLLSLAMTTAETTDLARQLASLGVPDGEARYSAQAARDGRTLVVVDAGTRSDEIRQLALDHGGSDVRSRGAELIRGDRSSAEAGVPGGVGARPIDITANWPDFASRYEMLWQQHYGTTDATWEQMEPLYRYAWQLANQPRYRGRPWSEVAAAVQRDWGFSSLAKTLSWDDAAGPIEDVWDDVAEEAASGAEGGADRRIPSQGTDQTIAARDVQSSRRGAA